MATVVTTAPEVAVATVRTLPAVRQTPLSLWHLLSLDAPCVAALWTAFVAWSFGAQLPWTAPLAMGLAVWMLYAADRLSDARHGIDLEERHRFHHRHRFAFTGALIGAVPLLALLVTLLPHQLRSAWLLLAIPLAAYVCAVHLLRLPRVPKEHLVAVFFALAIAAPVRVLGHVSAFSLLPPTVSFGAVCWLNCAAIARWERAPRSPMDPGTAWAAHNFRAAAIIVVLLGTACAGVARSASGGHGYTGAAVAVASLLLLLLDSVRGKMAAITLRACADAALLTPLPVWVMLTLARR